MIADVDAPREPAPAPAPATCPDAPPPPVAPAPAVPALDVARELSRATRAFERGRLDDARAIAELVRAADPTAWEAPLLQARIFLERGDEGSAVEHARIAESLGAPASRTALLVAVALDELGESELARLAYARYLEVAPHGRYAAVARRRLGTPP